MKRTLTLILCAVCALLSCRARAEVVTLPLDFSPGMKLQASFPAKRGSEEFNHYEDPSITATYESAHSDEWHVMYYLARIRIANGSQLRTAAAAGFDRRGVARTEVMARRMNAVAAINGDYYTGNAGRYVLRQGQVFRDGMAENQDLLLIDEDGDFHIILAEEHPETMDRTTINGKRVNNALCFGPALIRDGEVVMNPDRAPAASNPKSGERRIALCQMGPLDYMVITVAYSGMTLELFTQFLATFDGIQQAYNLDGGNSCHLAFMGNWRDQTDSNGGDDYRSVPDIVYFASAWQAE